MTLRSYPEYREGGTIWLDKLPSHWEALQARRLFEQRRDNALQTDEQLSATQKYGVIPQRLFMEQEDQMVVLALSGLENFKHVEPDDFVISLRSFQGGIERSRHAGCVSPAYTVLRSVQKLAPRYWEYLFKCSPYIAALQTTTDGIREGKNISYGQFGGLKVPLPPVMEQIAIATFLDQQIPKIDSLIAEQERLIALLVEKRHAAISQAVMAGLSSDGEIKVLGSDIKCIAPSHWTETRLKKLFRQTKRQGYPEKQILSVYREFGVILKESRADNLNQTPDDVSTYQLVNPGDLVINKMKAWQGSLGISELEGITSPDYIVFAPLHAENAEYLHLLLRSKAMVSRYLPISNGIRPGQWRLESDAFLGQRIFLPPIEEQKSIARFVGDQVKKWGSLVEEAERGIDLLQQRRSTLIAAAVSGKIDVRTAVKDKMQCAEMAA